MKGGFTKWLVITRRALALFVLAHSLMTRFRSLGTQAHTPICRLCLHSAKRSLASHAYTDPKNSSHVSVTTTSDLRRSDRTTLEKAIRVDHAGEIAANFIYRGQMAVLGRDKKVGPVIQV